MLPLHDLAVKTNCIKPKLGSNIATVAVPTRWLEKGLFFTFANPTWQLKAAGN